MGKVNDLTGQVIGQRTVLEFVGLSKSRKALYRVRCSCGREDVRVGASLKYRDTCVGCRLRKPASPGEVYGCLTVLGESETSGWWSTKCEASGAVRDYPAPYVRTRKGKTCKACYSARGSMFSDGRHVPGWYLTRVRERALRKGMEFRVSTEFLDTLWEAQRGKCAMTGWDLQFSHTTYRDAASTASLDRIDSSQGYVPGNVQWLHRTVNVSKMTASDEEFISMCRAVAEHCD